MFVKHCSQDIQTFFANPSITRRQLEQKIIQPFLSVFEDQSLDSQQKSAALTSAGLCEGGMGPYGMSKAVVNAYTVELSKRFPNLLINCCNPGFIETDFSRPWADKFKKTPKEMGMLPVIAGSVAAAYLMMGDLEADIPGYKSGRYYESDGTYNPADDTINSGDFIF